MRFNHKQIRLRKYINIKTPTSSPLLPNSPFSEVYLYLSLGQMENYHSTLKGSPLWEAPLLEGSPLWEAPLLEGSPLCKPHFFDCNMNSKTDWRCTLVIAANMHNNPLDVNSLAVTIPEHRILLFFNYFLEFLSLTPIFHCNIISKTKKNRNSQCILRHDNIYFILYRIIALPTIIASLPK